MARHLQQDYRLIQTMIDDETHQGVCAGVESLAEAHPGIHQACAWGSEEQQELCRSDLRSMITRCAWYLDKSLGTCSEVIEK